MSITVHEEKGLFRLFTDHSEYAFQIAHGRYLEHRYYGVKTDEEHYIGRKRLRSFSPYDSDIGLVYSMSDQYCEFPFFGNGEFRAAALKLRSPSGDCCTRFTYSGYEIFAGRRVIPGIPSARATADTETLAVTLIDALTGCELVLYYTVFEKYDIISRYFSLKNNGTESVKIEKAMSLCLDLPETEYEMISLYGAHVDECNVQRNKLFFGNHRVMSRRGATSHQYNPFMALVREDTTEEKGDVFAFNFVYSGCFLDEAEVTLGAGTRVCIGLGEENFGYTLNGGEAFHSPEAVMMYTNEGLGDMSRKMHRFVRETIVPREIFPKRPVVLNTWEASYFDINCEKLVVFAKEGAKYGIDMLVMDDGWFGARNNDKAGLGDWFVNKEKFPDGLMPFIERVKKTGMRFGIWIEPEMINPDSDLYRAHPDWCLGCKGREGSLSRNQLVLDMANPQVIEYLKKSFQETFDGLPLDYIKWDFNRHISEPGSLYLPADHQDEVLFKFMLGVYELYYWFMEKYPNVMIENCSGGGGRYDLAMMALSTQIWTSDNTSASRRVHIQNGSLYGYPAYVMSCHVSNPMKAEDPMKALDYKFKVALGGMLGYELNILEMPQEVKEEIAKQIKLYRKVESIIKWGGLYRLIDPFKNKSEISAYYYAGEDGRILLSFLQNKADSGETEYTLPIACAKDGAVYTETLTGTDYTAAELRAGIKVKAAGRDENAEIWLFEEK